jgi:peptide/nickel transport system ATP-binding protein|tara:strand:- start:144 stop:278 length:135 start_codon:yes stop_codon:yes gene_type:complete
VFSPPHYKYTELLLSSVPEMDPDWLNELIIHREKHGVVASTSTS